MKNRNEYYKQYYKKHKKEIYAKVKKWREKQKYNKITLQRSKILCKKKSGSFLRIFYIYFPNICASLGS